MAVLHKPEVSEVRYLVQGKQYRDMDWITMLDTHDYGRALDIYSDLFSTPADARIVKHVSLIETMHEHINPVTTIKG